MYSFALSGNSSKTSNAYDKEFWGKTFRLRNVRQILWDVKTWSKFSLTGLTSETVLQTKPTNQPNNNNKKIKTNNLYVKWKRCQLYNSTDEKERTWEGGIKCQSLTQWRFASIVSLERGHPSKKRNQWLTVVKTLEQTHYWKADKPCRCCRAWLGIWWNICMRNSWVKEEACPR